MIGLSKWRKTVAMTVIQFWNVYEQDTMILHKQTKEPKNIECHKKETNEITVFMLPKGIQWTGFQPMCSFKL